MNQLVIMSLRSSSMCQNEVNDFHSCEYSFRTYGIEPALVDQILDILINHLVQSENDPLDVHTVRTLAQFMIETKNIILSLLNFALKHESVCYNNQDTYIFSTAFTFLGKSTSTRNSQCNQIYYRCEQFRRY